MSERTTDSQGHTLAHRVSLGVSIAVLVALAVVLMAGGRGGDPARPVVEVSDIRVAADGAHHVLVEVTNEGDRAGEGVQVTATLTVSGTEQTGDQTIDFLGADEAQTVVFVFDEDPADGDLEVRITSFAEP